MNSTRITTSIKTPVMQAQENIAELLWEKYPEFREKEYLEFNKKNIDAILNNATAFQILSIIKLQKIEGKGTNKEYKPIILGSNDYTNVLAIQILSNKLLKKGEIKEVLLKEDAIYDELTINAVKSMQKFVGIIPQTGNFGILTFTSLQKKLSEADRIQPQVIPVQTQTQKNFDELAMHIPVEKTLLKHFLEKNNINIATITMEEINALFVKVGISSVYHRIMRSDKDDVDAILKLGDKKEGEKNIRKLKMLNSKLESAMLFQIALKEAGVNEKEIPTIITKNLLPEREISYFDGKGMQWTKANMSLAELIGIAYMGPEILKDDFNEEVIKIMRNDYIECLVRLIQGKKTNDGMKQLKANAVVEKLKDSPEMEALTIAMGIKSFQIMNTHTYVKGELTEQQKEITNRLDKIPKELENIATRISGTHLFSSNVNGTTFIEDLQNYNKNNLKIKIELNPLELKKLEEANTEITKNDYIIQNDGKQLNIYQRSAFEKEIKKHLDKSDEIADFRRYFSSLLISAYFISEPKNSTDINQFMTCGIYSYMNEIVLNYVVENKREKGEEIAKMAIQFKNGLLYQLDFIRKTDFREYIKFEEDILNIILSENSNEATKKLEKVGSNILGYYATKIGLNENDRILAYFIHDSNIVKNYTKEEISNALYEISAYFGFVDNDINHITNGLTKKQFDELLKNNKTEKFRFYSLMAERGYKDEEILSIAMYFLGTGMHAYLNKTKETGGNGITAIEDIVNSVPTREILLSPYLFSVNKPNEIKIGTKLSGKINEIDIDIVVEHINGNKIRTANKKTYLFEEKEDILNIYDNVSIPEKIWGSLKEPEKANLEKEFVISTALKKMIDNGSKKYGEKEIIIKQKKEGGLKLNIDQLSGILSGELATNAIVDYIKDEMIKRLIELNNIIPKSKRITVEKTEKLFNTGEIFKKFDDVFEKYIATFGGANKKYPYLSQLTLEKYLAMKHHGGNLHDKISRKCGNYYDDILSKDHRFKNWDNICNLEKEYDDIFSTFRKVVEKSIDPIKSLNETEKNEFKKQLFVSNIIIMWSEYSANPDRLIKLIRIGEKQSFFTENLIDMANDATNNNVKGKIFTIWHINKNNVREKIGVVDFDSDGKVKTATIVDKYKNGITWKIGDNYCITHEENRELVLDGYMPSISYNSRTKLNTTLSKLSNKEREKRKRDGYLNRYPVMFVNGSKHAEITILNLNAKYFKFDLRAEPGKLPSIKKALQFVPVPSPVFTGISPIITMMEVWQTVITGKFWANIDAKPGEVNFVEELYKILLRYGHVYADERHTKENNGLLIKGIHNLLIKEVCTYFNSNQALLLKAQNGTVIINIDSNGYITDTVQDTGYRLQVKITGTTYTVTEVKNGNSGQLISGSVQYDENKQMIFTLENIYAPVYLTLNNILNKNLWFDTQASFGMKFEVPFEYNLKTKLPREYNEEGIWNTLPFLTLSRPFKIGQWIANPYIMGMWDSDRNNFMNMYGFSLTITNTGKVGFSLSGGAGYNQNTTKPLYTFGVGISARKIQLGIGINYVEAGYDRDKNGTLDHGVRMIYAKPVWIPDIIIDGRGIIRTIFGWSASKLKGIYRKTRGVTSL